MAGIIYSKMSGKNDAMYGKFEAPIKALIENESNLCEKNKNIVDFLYNVEKSNNSSEAIVAESDFDTFQSTLEGGGAENDEIQQTYKKIIEHITFKKEFTVTREMADDSKIGISANIKNKPKKFVRSYYRTRNKLAALALANATASSFVFNKATVDLTSPDGEPLFDAAHPYATDKMKGSTQANFFWSASLCATTAEFTASLAKLSNTLRNFRDENGEVMGYVADTIIIPGNRPALEAIAKTVVGSERQAGNGNNDINIQYGNWTLVVLTDWESTDDRFMIMSSAANKDLLGNMFYNRVPLDVQNEIDIHTRNYIWNGYCRFGVGFGSWKHILLAVDAANAVAGAAATDLNA